MASLIGPGLTPRMSLRAAPDGGVSCHLVFGQERWAYPRIALPRDITLNGFDAVLIKARGIGRSMELVRLGDGQAAAP
jgi:hypothetical protein